MNAIVLLDTHVIVWLVNGDRRLGAETRALLKQSITSEISAISAISVYEFSWIVARKPIQLNASPDSVLQGLLRTGVTTLDVTGAIARMAATLAISHGDPIDRIIAATAITHDAMLVTADEVLVNAKLGTKIHDARF